MTAANLFSIDPADRGQFAWVKHACMFHYVEGFEEAVRVLLERIEQESDHMTTDSLVYPLMFTCRHAIELRLKELIGEGNRCIGTTEKVWGHDLISLWETGRKIVVAAQPSYPVAELDAMEAVIGQFQAVDTRADAFRYPTLGDGKPSLSGVDGFSLGRLVKTALQVCELLDYVAGGITAEYEFRTDMEHELRTEMAGETP